MRYEDQLLQELQDLTAQMTRLSKLLVATSDDLTLKSAVTAAQVALVRVDQIFSTVHSLSRSA